MQRVQAEMERNLAAMRRYAESLGRGDCLREEVLGYLGANKPPTRLDQCCTLCDVNLALPWPDEPRWEDLADPARYQDAKYAVLKAAAWNWGLSSEQGRAPYSTRTLAYVLLGNDCMATRWTKDPERKKARMRHILGSEHFGVLEGLQGGVDAVMAVVEELRGGYVEEVERGWNGNSYRYLGATEMGGRLEEGRLFG